CTLMLLAFLLYLARHKLYLPITILAVGMMVFQPYSTIPHSQAATTQKPNPTPEATSQQTEPNQQFNPLVSPIEQVGFLKLPAAETNKLVNITSAPAQPKQLISTRDASTTASNPDTDGDGLSDQEEALIGTDPNIADTDSDGLNDFAEVQLGTNPQKADTDSDGINDYVEVATFTQFVVGGIKYYTNPLEADTNGDRINDGFECANKINLTKNSITALISANTAIPNCTATTAGIPDFISFDNDNDKVPDDYDVAANISNTTTYSDASPFLFNIKNASTTAIKPLTVQFQIRPINKKLLYANNAIYDWPSGDSEGQITRVLTSTFQSSNLFLAQDAKAKNGDIKVTAMLEFRIPIEMGSPTGNYGNLPVTNCANVVITNTIRLNPNDANSCIDKSKTAPYGMSIGWSRKSDGTEIKNEVTASVPLLEDYDANGTVIAYTGQIYYETAAKPWKENSIRLQWLISAIQDSCPRDKPDCAVNERIESNSLIQNYYSDFTVAGVHATENYGSKNVVIYEDGTKSSVT
ncbi:MAG: hypothetical protein NT020_12605, partial [Chloroflexales bacterium]|nr:hypothetical protein [Chloroflexales bacterium]